MKAGGIVLCGGKSTRMGVPKATLPFGPETMLQRVLRLLSTAVSPVVVVAAPGNRYRTCQRASRSRATSAGNGVH
jgi:molybdopterin-guanine dinucleotide biosynthesis protein A